jgi:hypothetical protein
MTDDRDATCSYKKCGKTVAAHGRCRGHQPGFRKTARFGHDRERVKWRARFPGGLDSPRTRLVDALAAALGDDCASAVADALDAYLETDPADRRPAFQWNPPDYKSELDRAIRQRDEAVARAERAEGELVRARKK